MGLGKGGGVLIKNRARFIELFSQKLSFWPEASSLRVQDVKNQVVWTHTSREHNLPHPYAPTSAIFHHWPKMAIFCQKLSFLAKQYQFLALIRVFWVWVVSW